MRKKYATEEERKEAHREAVKKWYQAKKEEKREYDRRRYQANKEKIAEYRAEYYQSNKEKIAEYYKANKDKIAEYYQTNKDRIAEQQAEYRATPIGRATYLLSGYRQSDKQYNRGECTLTPQWIVDNIFTSKCHWCGETDWTKLGCDRIDNSKPHTPDNVNPCCEECNKKRGTMDYYEFKKKWG